MPWRKAVRGSQWTGGPEQGGSLLGGISNSFITSWDASTNKKTLKMTDCFESTRGKKGMWTHCYWLVWKCLKEPQADEIWQARVAK